MNVFIRGYKYINMDKLNHDLEEFNSSLLQIQQVVWGVCILCGALLLISLCVCVYHLRTEEKIDNLLSYHDLESGINIPPSIVNESKTDFPE